jgi:hypothetical protein
MQNIRHATCNVRWALLVARSPPHRSIDHVGGLLICAEKGKGRNRRLGPLLFSPSLTSSRSNLFVSDDPLPSHVLFSGEAD